MRVGLLRQPGIHQSICDSKVSKLDLAQRGERVLFGQHHRAQLVADVALDILLENQVGDNALHLVVRRVLALPLERCLKVLYGAGRGVLMATLCMAA